MEKPKYRLIRFSYEKSSKSDFYGEDMKCKSNDEIIEILMSQNYDKYFYNLIKEDENYVIFSLAVGFDENKLKK